MNKLGIISSACLIIGLSSTAYAGSMGPVDKAEAWYMVGGAGYSASIDPDITTDPAVWDFANQGYSNDLGSSAAIFFGVGRYLTDYLRLDARVEHRGDYNYSQYQTGAFNGVSGFTGDVRTRKFKLDSNSVMVSGWLDLGNLSPRLLWQVSSMSIQPFVGGGIGVDYLNVKDFRTIGAAFGVNRNEIPSVNQTSTGSSFAWHVGAGLAAQLTSRTTLAVGYKYFDGGTIPFPDYILSSLSAPSGRTGVSVTPWDGTFRANEAYAELRVLI